MDLEADDRLVPGEDLVERARGAGHGTASLAPAPGRTACARLTPAGHAGNKRSMRGRPDPAGDFEEFQASALFCGRCRTARPVRERLLLVLPDGELYEYLCAACGSSVGTRKAEAAAAAAAGPRLRAALFDSGDAPAVTSRPMMTAPIDLRSDTVTRPTPAMRKAMAEAEVGDDVFGEDPTVARLEARVAELLGFEAALFVPSGTMGNAIAIRVLTSRGDEVLVERRSHVVRYELSALSVLSGVMPRMVDAPAGHLTPDDRPGRRGPPAYYKSDVTLVVLENTHNLAGGTVLGAAESREVIAAAREAGFAIHVDGARIWNAAVALGVSPSALVAGADTVMTCLSKGLGCPVGSLVASSRTRIEKARRVRKLLGGGMRQAGVLAAAGLVALDESLPAAGRGPLPRAAARGGPGSRPRACGSPRRRRTSWWPPSRVARPRRSSPPSRTRGSSPSRWTPGRCASSPTATSARRTARGRSPPSTSPSPEPPFGYRSVRCRVVD